MAKNNKKGKLRGLGDFTERQLYSVNVRFGGNCVMTVFIDMDSGDCFVAVANEHNDTVVTGVVTWDE